MPYNGSLAFTNSQLRDQGMRNALEDFMGFFKAKKTAADEAEKQAMIKEIAGGAPASTTGAAGGPMLGMDAAGMPTGIQDGQQGEANTRHLADVKAKYLMKYGQAPVTGQDMLAQDLMTGEKVAQIGDSQRKRERDRALEGKVDAFGKVIDADAALSPSEKAFYGVKPEAYGERLKPSPVTYLPTLGGDYMVAPTRAQGAAAPVAQPLITDAGAPVKAPPKASEKSLTEIEAEAAARAKGTAAAAGEKPLSGDAAKLSGYVSTLETQGNRLKQLIKDNGIRKVVFEYKKGNPAFVNLIEDVADAKGRLRSGGAVNKEESDRFKQPFTGLGNLVYGDNDAALNAIDQALAEAATVQKGMGHKTAPSSKFKILSVE